MVSVKRPIKPVDHRSPGPPTMHFHFHRNGNPRLCSPLSVRWPTPFSLILASRLWVMLEEYMSFTGQRKSQSWKSVLPWTVKCNCTLTAWSLWGLHRPSGNLWDHPTDGLWGPSLWVSEPLALGPACRALDISQAIRSPVPLLSLLLQWFFMELLYN